MSRPIGLVGTAIAGAYFDGDSPNITAAVAHSAHYGLAEFSSADGKLLHPSQHKRFNPTRGLPHEAYPQAPEVAAYSLKRSDDLPGYIFR